MISLDVDAVLKSMLATAESLSDCLFVVGRPPQAEVFGKLKAIEVPGLGVLTPEHTEFIAGKLTEGLDRLQKDLQATGSCDTSYSLGTIARFRVNIFKQSGKHAIVMRRLTTQIPTIDGLKLPPIFKQIVKEKNGLIFVTGATGSGKTTTLASMLNEVNQAEAYHVVTLEDPIEFLHPHRTSTFSQRELGRDFPDFATGARAAMRQAPKVILVGEIRDRETMEVALTAAETGHVVYTTMHTINIPQSINRILGFFSRDEEVQVRQRLADVFRYGISQRLVPKINGGRQLVSEVMGSSLRVREAILLGESEVRDIHEIIESSTPLGWHSFEQSLVNAYKAGRVTEDTAMLYSVNKNSMGRELDQVKKGMLPIEESETGLRLDHNSLHSAKGNTPLPR